MKQANHTSFSKPCRQINLQVLSVIAEECRNDSAAASLMFGLPAELAKALSHCSLVQLEMISATQPCLLTLKNSGDTEYWGKLIKESEAQSEIHRLNLMALSMNRIHDNKLYADQPE